MSDDAAGAEDFLSRLHPLALKSSALVGVMAELGAKAEHTMRVFLVELHGLDGEAGLQRYGKTQFAQLYEKVRERLAVLLPDHTSLQIALGVVSDLKDAQDERNEVIHSVAGDAVVPGVTWAVLSVRGHQVKVAETSLDGLFAVIMRMIQAHGDLVQLRSALVRVGTIKPSAQVWLDAEQP